MSEHFERQSLGAVGAARPLLLQRRCACGRPLAGGGECEECRRKRQATELEPAWGGGADSFGRPLEHDFSAVRARTGVGRLQRQATNDAAARQPAPEPRPPVRDWRVDIGRGGNRFDAEIDRSNCRLTLQMDVRFHFLEPPFEEWPYESQRKHLRRWPNEELKARWQENYIRAVTRRWSFRHILVPSRDCPTETCQSVFCRVQVKPVTGVGHYTVHVGYSGHRGKVGAATRQGMGEAFLTQEDVELDPQRTKSMGFPQVGAEHEFGHMLGLQHVACSYNSLDCYGTTDEEKANIMGRGSIVSPSDYQVFGEAMDQFSNCGWKAKEPRGTLGRGLGSFLGFGAGAALGGLIGSLFGPLGIVVGTFAGGLIGTGLGYLLGNLAD